ncbi:hypothetical protein Mame01_41230 [Microbispora amethystogenes]|nr:hypothetical protein Mame01_41230 [Microbispora amethystogenes]
MSDIYVTLSGNVTDDPRQYRFRDGSHVTSMRMAVNRRVLDQQTNTWQTRDTTYYVVRCYRGLADNVQQSIRKGHPVVVYGKLRIKQFEREGEQRFWAEIEASSVGHDLKWGITTYEKPIRAYSAGAVSDDDRQAMEDATREWELTGRTAAGARPADGGETDEAFDALVGGRSTTAAERPALGAPDGERGDATADADPVAEPDAEPDAEGDAGVVTGMAPGVQENADHSPLPRALAA